MLAVNQEPVRESCIFLIVKFWKKVNIIQNCSAGALPGLLWLFYQYWINLNIWDYLELIGDFLCIRLWSGDGLMSYSCKYPTLRQCQLIQMPDPQCGLKSIRRRKSIDYFSCNKLASYGFPYRCVRARVTSIIFIIIIIVLHT